ncbi:MAG: HsdM family class I SAM-dependent methyltransferase [Promethearchaeota archaeon]
MNNKTQFQYILQSLNFYKQKSRYYQYFKLWQADFEKIYQKSELDKELFQKHASLIFNIGLMFYQKFNIISMNSEFSFKEFQSKLQIPNYFFWIFQESRCLALIKDSPPVLQNNSQDSTDPLSELYQLSIAHTIRHPKGEFYTNPGLAEQMVEESYNFGEKVIDPTCGSGTFLLCIIRKILQTKFSEIKKIEAINNIYGIDINPIACVMARANLYLLLPIQWQPKINIRIFRADALFLSKDPNFETIIFNSFNLVIGNPPWLVLNRIPSKNDKDKTKKLGNELGILRGGKLATSTELTTIFIYKSLRDFLKDDGKIFFVTPASLATGSQHGLFRQFRGMSDIEIWSFDTDVYRIHNLCFRAKKAGKKEGKIVEKSNKNDRYNVIWKVFHVNQNTLNSELIKKETYIPATIERQHLKLAKENNDYLKPEPGFIIGRLVSTESLNTNNFNQKEIDHSHYHKLFRQGASLVPRNLIFVDFKEIKVTSKTNSRINTVKIEPSVDIQSKKYSTWEFQAFKSALCEKEYIFPAAKSTGLIPFFYIKPYSVFLPIEKENIIEDKIEDEKENEKKKYESLKYRITTPLQPNARLHFENLKKIYKENLKPGAKIQSFTQRLNYGKALTNSRQFQLPKVIFAGIGTIVKGAILTKPAIIDTSLYYYIPDSLDEAYYLIGFFNSPEVTNYVRHVGSTGANNSLRNIHKHPLNCGLPKFDEKQTLHTNISQKARDIEKFVRNFVKQITLKNSDLKGKPKSIQNRLMKDSGYLLLRTSLDQLIKKLIS